MNKSNNRRTKLSSLGLIINPVYYLLDFLLAYALEESADKARYAISFSKRAWTLSSYSLLPLPFVESGGEYDRFGLDSESQLVS